MSIMVEAFEKMMQWGLRGFFALVALVIAGAGLYFLWWNLQRLYWTLHISHWHFTVGTVTESKVDIDDGSDSYRYSPAVTYTYQVDGHHYTGDRIHFATSGLTSPRQAQQQTAPYPKGARVKVYYQPSRPERAVLEPGLNAQFIAPFFLGSTFAALGILVALVAVGLVDPFHFIGWLDSPWLKRLLPYAGLAAGLAVCGLALATDRRIRASRSWPHTPGLVVAADIATEASSSSSASGGPLYWPEIAFEYEVEGQVYTANTVHFVEYHSTDHSRAERLVARYPKGTAVDVRYDPDDPTLAVLEPTSGGLWLYWAIGLSFALVSTLFILIG
ncbi:MAG: DUF3592 domain-containing protein [Candidatus Latescibacteria bacterium]|nr:DUF3592 domain-containing protein [Candidatus Latescibacterota bacterium]